MTGNKSALRRVLLASTAAATLGLGAAGSAHAQALASIDNAGIIDIDAGIDAFIAATSQIATGGDVTSSVSGAAGTLFSIDQEATGAIAPDQTLTSNIAESITRLNQSIASVDVAAPSGAGRVDNLGDPLPFTGATEASTGAGVSINAGAGILSLQEIAATGAITSSIGDLGDPVLFEVDLTAGGDGVEGDVVASGNRAEANTLANDATNTLSAVGAGSGALDVPVAIASLQSFVSDGVATDDVSALSAASVLADMNDSDLDGDVRLDENVIGARAGLNTVANQLVAGNGDSTALGGVGGTLTAGAADGPGAIASFNADVAIASLQSILGDAEEPEEPTAVTATTQGTVGLVLAADPDPGNAAAVTSDLLTARGNTILSQAEGNVGENRAIATTSGINGLSVGVASLQEFIGQAGGADVTATTTGVIGMATDLAAFGEGGDLTGTEVELSGNRIGASAAANDAFNVAAVTSTGSLGGIENFVVGRQEASAVTVTATTSADIVGSFERIGGPDASGVLNNNEAFATAALNTQTNVLQNVGASGFAPSTMVGVSRQEIQGGGVTADVTRAEISLTGGAAAAGSDAAATLSANRVLASATGNMSTTSITNRGSSFSFRR